MSDSIPPLSGQIPRAAPNKSPQFRLFPIQSFGLGTAANIDTIARSLRELNVEVTREMCTQVGLSEHAIKHNDTRSLLEKVEQSAQ